MGRVCPPDSRQAERSGASSVVSVGGIPVLALAQPLEADRRLGSEGNSASDVLSNVLCSVWLMKQVEGNLKTP